MKHRFDRSEYEARKAAAKVEKAEIKALRGDVEKLKKPKETGK